MKNFLYLILFNVVLCAGSTRAETYDVNRFEVTTVCTDLVQPMEFELAPDGRIFLIEIGGTLKTIDPATGRQEVVGKVTVTTAQENGLIGLALDPHFEQNHWIYLQYSPPDFTGQRVSRFDFRDNQLILDSEKILFTYQEQRRECCHHAGSLEFGPDGNLYIGTGDNTNPFNDSQGFAPIDERSDREPWDAQRTAGNTKSYNGKVLRIRPLDDGTYAIPDGNLFPKDGIVGHPEIYVMGCRNPWRISVDQKTGFLYWGDVGPDAGSDGPRGPRGYDEVNQAKTAGNYGWPYFIGNNFAYSMVDFATGTVGSPQDPSAPINRSVNNTGAKELPPARPAMVYYPSANFETFPEVATGGRTACAGPVYYFDEKLESTTKFPAEFDRTLFAFEWSRNAIYAVQLDDQSNFVALKRFMPQRPFIRPIALKFTPSGSLFVLEYGETWGVNADAKLVRVDYVRGNRRPTAVARSANDVGREPLTVSFNASESLDKDGDAITYRWTMVPTTGEAAQRTAREIGHGANAEFTFNAPGVYTVSLEVKDPSGATDVTTLPVVVGNSRPVVEFASPLDGDFFEPGKPVSYQLVVRDREDGTSDEAQAEEDGWRFIDGSAPSRLFVESIPVASKNAAAEPEAPPGLALIRKSDCLNCHAANRTLVGPSFVDIANKYRNQSHQLEQSVMRVIQGSTGVWGKVGMLPHQQHSPAEVRAMVEYVYSVTAGASNPTVNGFRNEVATSDQAQSLRLEATYTDMGRGDIPKLIGGGSVVLRSRRVQAEDAEQFAGTRILGSGKAENMKFMGAIEHDGYLRFLNIRFNAIRRVVARVASAGVGGTIEIHANAVDGPLLGSAPVTVNGQWEEFYDLPIDIKSDAGRGDLLVVFKNEKNRGGLMNVDSLFFE